jgi:hypothetical protein
MTDFRDSSTDDGVLDANILTHDGQDIARGASIVVATAAMIALVLTLLVASFAPASAAMRTPHDLSNQRLIEAVTVSGLDPLPIDKTTPRDGHFSVAIAGSGDPKSLAPVLAWVVLLGAGAALIENLRQRLSRRVI